MADHPREQPDQTGEKKQDTKSGRRRLGRITEMVNRSYVERTGQADDKVQEEALLRAQLQQIAVVAFIGPSGTGKSTRAIMVARQNKIGYIIDDGLLINGGRIVAGLSAKKAMSRLESVRQALFADETRAAVMRRALAEHHPAALMILGTSDGMLEKICRNLWLNPPSMLIRIEDISTEEEMREAKNTRMTEGKHTIPVPSMEIKHEFSGYFSDPFWRRLRRRDRSVPTQFDETERTVVRPTFSGLGSYSISDDAMRDMVRIILRRVRGVAELVDFRAEKEIYGVVIDMELSLVYGFKAQSVLSEAQERVSRQIEEFTSINVMAVNVRAKRVVHSALSQRGQTVEGST